MKILLAGAFGNLGIEILRVLCEGGHEVIAADLKEKENNGLEGKYTFRAIDATKKETMKGICDGIEVVITTMGLTTSSTKFTAYDIDYQGNLNLLEEAKASGVGKFNYISVIACKEPGAEKVPMLHAKAMFEDELVKSGLEYVIYRPTGYFYDIAKVFNKKELPQQYFERWKTRVLSIGKFSSAEKDVLRKIVAYIGKNIVY